MMILTVALLSLSALCLAVPLPQAPGSGKPPVPIVSQDQDVNFDGHYHYSFEGGDGTKAVADGELKQLGDGAGEISRGAFSYVGDDGKNYGIQYTADENGFQPIGDHLPQPPPIPEAIAKALAYLATKPPSKDDQ